MTDLVTYRCLDYRFFCACPQQQELSFLSERDARGRSPQRLGWTTQHSPDYIDVREKKDREIDVTASRSWRRERKSGLHVAHLHLVIECKGIHKEALLLAKMMDRHEEADRLYHHWLGLDDDDLRNAIGTVAQDAGFDAEKVLRPLRIACVSAGTGVVYPLLVNAPPAPIRASAIREAERDEEESLIRKAMLQLHSAVQGTVTSVRDDIAEPTA